jgi:hypothetical protein
MDSLSGVGLSGLQSATEALDRAALKIAKATEPATPQAQPAAGPNAALQFATQAPPPTDVQANARLDNTLVGLASGQQQGGQAAQGTDQLAQGLVDQTAAAAAYKANLKTLQTADELAKATLDLKA